MEQNSTNDADRKFTTKQLQDAGASDEFISLYLSALPSGAKVELDEGYGGTVLERGDDPTSVAGGWFTKMWEGKLFWALCYADGRNTAALAELFDRDDFIRDGVDSENEPLDYVQRMVEQNLEQIA